MYHFSRPSCARKITSCTFIPDFQPGSGTSHLAGCAGTSSTEKNPAARRAYLSIGQFAWCEGRTFYMLSTRAASLIDKVCATLYKGARSIPNLDGIQSCPTE